MYRDPAETFIFCKTREKQLPLLSCAACPKYPCAELDAGKLDILENSLFVAKAFGGWLARRTHMYIFKKADGSLVEAPADFDADNPDLELIEDVEEVLVISKTLVKQVRLVVKSKDIREAIRKEQETKTRKKSDKEEAKD